MQRFGIRKAIASAVILFVIAQYFLHRSHLSWIFTDDSNHVETYKSRTTIPRKMLEYGPAKVDRRFTRLEKKVTTKLSIKLKDHSSHTPLPSEEYRQTSRKNNLKRTCEKLRLNTTFPTGEDGVRKLLGKVKLLYSDSHRYLICEIPKCGCSSIKKLMAVTENLVKERDPQAVRSGDAHIVVDRELNLKSFKNFSEISTRLESYKKLIIIRDPFYRLLSAYRNKMETAYPWAENWAKISRKIHKDFGKSKDGGMATFAEFLDFVAKDHERDRHWDLYNELCSPCMINYDFIAHIETIEEDMIEFFEQVQLKNTSFPHNYDRSQETDQAKFNGYFKNVSVNVAEDIYKEFSVDFELFRFNKPEKIQDRPTQP